MRYSISKGTEELHLEGKYWFGDPTRFFGKDIIDRLYKFSSTVDSVVLHYGEFDIPIFNAQRGYYSISKEDGIVLDVIGMAPVGALMALIPYLLVEGSQIMVHGELLKLKGVVVYYKHTVSVGEYFLSPMDDLPGFNADLYE